jgi:hypothetical protein
MELAIKDVLPDTTHRWCKWHVLRKAKESLGVVYGKKSDFKDEFHKLVHHMITKEEFEDGWAKMLEKYSLQKHPFLTQKVVDHISRYCLAGRNNESSLLIRAVREIPAAVWEISAAVGASPAAVCGG